MPRMHTVQPLFWLEARPTPSAHQRAPVIWVIGDIVGWVALRYDVNVVSSYAAVWVEEGVVCRFSIRRLSPDICRRCPLAGSLFY